MTAPASTVKVAPFAARGSLMFLLIPLFVILALCLLCAAAAGWFMLGRAPAAVKTVGQLSEREHQGRRYLAYVPPTLAPGAGVVLVLHGGARAEQARRGTGYRFEQLADERGFVVAYPQPFEGAWNDSRKLLPVAARQQGVDDSAYLASLAQALVAEHGLDTRRVFVFGHSSGGQMALRLAVERPDAVQGVAVTAACLPAPGNDVATHRRRMVPVLMVNGTVDPLTAFNGGSQSLFGFSPRGELLSARATAEHFAALAQAPNHDSEPLPMSGKGDSTQVIRHRWSVSAGPRVELYEVRGGGHALPRPNGRGPRGLGLQTAALDAPVAACDFFGLQAPSGS